MKSNEISQFLESSEYIDWDTPDVLAKAQHLAVGRHSDEEIAKACFEFVRDGIRHSGDHQLNPVTSRASDVLKYETGYCYSKSHLLAALLRANQIPAALCYQRLTIENNRPPYCLHGLNAVHLARFGWYRIDARGNRDDVSARFEPPHEMLAFPIRNTGEEDIPGYFHEPMDEVVEVLETYLDFRSVAENLPDFQSVRSDQGE